MMTVNVPSTPVTGQDTATNSGIGHTANQGTNKGELTKLMTVFFSQGQNDTWFEEFLIAREMTTMSDLYTLGTLQVPQLNSIFEEDAEPFQNHIAMIMTLATYMQTYMVELVDTQANRMKLTWKKVNNNGFRRARDRIHMRAVHETHMGALQAVTRGSHDDKDAEIAKSKWFGTIGNQDPKPSIGTTEPCILQHASINPKLSWNGKIDTFDTYKGAIESWAIQHGMDCLIDPDFMEVYSLCSFSHAKREANVSANITAKQFIHDNKVLYGAIKSSTRVFCPTNQYVIKQNKSKDGVMTWYNFNQDYNGENNMEVKIAEVGLMLEKDYDPAQKGGVIQYLDDLEATWALLAHMDLAETASSRAKIQLVINKLG